MEGSLSARWMTCWDLGNGTIMLQKLFQSRMANYFHIFPPLVFSYRLFFFTNRENFQVRTWVWRKFAAEIRVNFQRGDWAGVKWSSQSKKQIFLLCQISPSASSTRDLGTRLAVNGTNWLTTKLTDEQREPSAICYTLKFCYKRNLQDLDNPQKAYKPKSAPNIIIVIYRIIKVEVDNPYRDIRWVIYVSDV